MAAPKRTKGEIERDLVDIASMFLQGKSTRNIAIELSSSRSYSICHTGIYAEIKKLLKAWKETALQDVSEHVATELQKLYLVEQQAWKSHFNSMGPTKRLTTKKSPSKDNQKQGKTYTELEESENFANPAWMNIILKCIDKRCKLLGLNKEKETSGTTFNQQINVTLPDIPHIDQTDWYMKAYKNTINE